MKKIIYTLLFLFTAYNSFALTDTVKNTFGKSELVPGYLLKGNVTTSTVSGSRFSSLPLTATSTFTLESASSIIEFSINKGVKAGTVLAGTPKITLEVTSWVYNGTNFDQPTQTITLDLEVSASKSVLRAYKSFKNAHQIKVKVISLTGVPATSWDFLELNTYVVTSSYDNLANTPDFSSLQHSTTLTDGNLNVSWGNIVGAEGYELEWTYVAGMDDDNLLNDPKPDVARVLSPDSVVINGLTFRNNSSRVTLIGNSFDIPMVYENGYVLYRLRAIGKRKAGTDLVEYKSTWSQGENNSSTYLNTWKSGTNNNYILFTGLETLKNWQSSISFAEEGKTKTVVTYHDGSMRNRQVVTRINSDKRTIVGETLYDYAGRPTIQLLPVPTTTAVLTYFPNFNTTEENKTLLLKDHYILTPATGTCSATGPEFDIDNGASNYYSSANSFLNLNPGDAPATDKIINRDLIPSAEKYPYTQTEYTLDNTGRINSQSGVGKNHILGSGHETSYSYATPDQGDLTRLFGTQVGNASHYKKNLVIDPNGQVSTSYLDLDGKVVATALAGDNPDNLSNVSTQTGRQNVEDVLKGNSSNLINSDKDKINFTKKITVTSDNTAYEFKYDATATTYDVNCDLSTPTSKTFDGPINVELTLVDKCGTPLITNNDATNSGYSGVVQKLELNPKITLDKGDYTLTKTLTINKQAIENYWNNYLLDTNTNCLKTIEDFEAEQAAAVNVAANCNFGCAECEALLDSIPPTSRDFKLMKKLCKTLCGDDVNPCELSLDAMKADMSPSGQYGEIRPKQADVSDNEPKLDNDGNVIASTKKTIQLNNQTSTQDINPSLFPLSIFNDANYLSQQIIVDGNKVKPSWKSPIKVKFHSKTSQTQSDEINDVMYENTLPDISNYSYEITNYYNEDKSLATVKVKKETNSAGIVTYTPELDPAGIMIFNATCNIANECEVPVKFLKNFVDFENLWKPSWGIFLAPFHPEFKYYLNCVSNASVYAFEIKMARCTTLAQAVSNGYISGTEATGFQSTLLSTDPIKNFADSTGKKWVIDYMNDKTAVYEINKSVNPVVPFSMIQMATTMVRCPYGSSLSDACSSGLPVTCTETKLYTVDDWMIYKNLYIGERQKVLRKLINEKSAAGMFYNGCIGHADYLNNSDAIAFKRPIYISTTGTKKVSSCPWGSFLCPTTKDVPVRSFFARVPFLVENQACYIFDSYLYVKKQQRNFITTSANSSTGSGVESNCSSTATYTYKDVVTGDDVTEYIAQPCSTDIVNTINAGITNAQRMKYAECGLCPIATELQNVLVQLFDTKISTTSTLNTLLYQTSNLPALHVNCESSVVKMPSLIAGLFTTTPVTNLPDVTWTSVLTSDKKTVNGEFVSGTKKIKIAISIPPISTENGLRTSIDLDSILSICCIDIDRISGGNNKFFLKANYFDKRSTTNIQVKPVYLIGTVTFEDIVADIDNCSFPPLCAVSDKAHALVGFLNALTTKVGICPSATTCIKDSKLFAATPVNLCDNVENAYLYTPTLTKILPISFSKGDVITVEDKVCSYSPNWYQAFANNILAGELRYKIPGSIQELNYKIKIDFNNSGYVFSADNFVEFTNITPVSNGTTNTGDAFKMMADIKYKTIDVNGVVDMKYAPVIIEADFKLSLCKTFTRPTSVNPK